MLTKQRKSCFHSPTVMGVLQEVMLHNGQSYAPGLLELCSTAPKAMLSDSGSYAFGLGELCFPTRGVMLSDSGSYAFQLQKLCFPTSKAMLSDFKSYALAADGQGYESRKARKWLTNSNLGAFPVLAVFPHKDLPF
jgi:hypothetical protein